MSGSFRGGRGVPGQKSANFSASARRLLGRFAPEKGRVGLVIVLAIIAVVLSVVTPKVMGHATNEIYYGVVGKSTGPMVEQLKAAGQIPQDQQVTPAYIADLLRKIADSPQALAQYNDMQAKAAEQSGQDAPKPQTAKDVRQQADMIGSMDFTPGQGINYDKLGEIILTVLLLYIISALFNWIQGFILAGVVQRIMYRLRRDVDHKINKLPLKYFDGQTRGEVLSRVTNDIDNIGTALQQTISQLMVSIFTIFGVLIMMLTISWELSLVGIATIPVAIIIAAMIMKRSQRQFVAQWEWTGKLNSHVEEMHTGHQLVQVFNRRKEAIEVFDDRNDKMFQASFKAQFISGIIQPAMMFVTNLNFVIIAVWGGLKVSSGTMSLGDVQAFIQYSRQFTQPIAQVASQMNMLQSGVASAERVFELLDEAEETPDPEDPIVLTEVQGRVEFEDVSFSYSPDRPLIEDLKLWAKPGQTVAIVGHTGAGKTTLVNLLMRFYDVNGGKITLDGVDTRMMTRDNLRSHFGMVLQDTWLFGGSIRDNIAYGADVADGAPAATEEQIHAAAEAAYVDRFVRHLPEGYDTIIDEEGSNVSAGEKQLITIARAFLSDPSILILDEATSSVDTRTEVLIQRAMANLRAGRTSFVIAHRLSTIRDADVIVVMANGAIVEKGNHEELIAARGAYYDLYNSQFEGAME